MDPPNLKDWTYNDKTGEFNENVVRHLRWCKHGNACLWHNCPFRHERCLHFDNWLARDKRGYACRSLLTDGESCKSSEEGGCKYDHRDPINLQIYIHTLPCSTEKELWDSFYDLCLRWPFGGIFDISQMSRTDKGLLIRSLRAANIEFEDKETWIEMYIE